MLYEWKIVLNHLGIFLLAFLLCLPIGWEREQRGHSAGFRTFTMVAIVASGYVLIGKQIFFIEKTEGQEALARVIYGIITGIGFIGAGSIVRSKDIVYGTATASGIWCAGSIGVAVAMECWDIGIILSFMALLIFQVKKNIKNNSKIKGKSEK